MRIRSFTVNGFGGFTESVTFGPLEELNVLYGANNSGKSSLLRAIELYFRLLGAGEAVTPSQPQILDHPGDALQDLLAASFNRYEPAPITLEASWSLSDGELEEAGLMADFSVGEVDTVLELTGGNRVCEVRVQKWKMADRDAATASRDNEPALISFGQQIRRLLSDARPFQFEKPVMPFAVVGHSADLFPQSLRDALFDARQSTSPEKRQRWALFVETAGSLAEELGVGAWETTFDRSAGRADLVYVRGDEALLLPAMGAGVQRMAGLLAELALTDARYIAMEEPEWRLSPALQRRLASLAARIVQAGLGPRQFFISTHSPVLAGCGEAFSLESGAGGAYVERRAWKLDAPAPNGSVPASAAQAPLGLAESRPEPLNEGAPDRTFASAHTGV